MLKYIVLVLVFIAFVLASYEDIRKREVYDYLNFSLFFFVLVIGIFDSVIMSNSYTPILFVLFGSFLGLFLGSLLFYLGTLGGGDVKFLVGFGAAMFYLQPFSSFLGLESFSYEFLRFISLKFSSVLLYFMYFLLAVLILGLLTVFGVCFTLPKRDRRNSAFLSVLFILLILCFASLLFLTHIPSEIFLSMGFVVFLILFVFEDSLFRNIYLTLRKSKKKVKPGMILKNQKNVPRELCERLLTKKDVSRLEEDSYLIKKPLPLFSLVLLSCGVFVAVMSMRNEVYFSYFFSLIFFTFLSLLVGGLVTLFIVFKTCVVQYKKLKVKFSRVERVLLSVFFVFGLIGLFFDVLLALIMLHGCLAIIVLNFGKQAEKLRFTSPKSVSKIVLGDWIVEDVVISKRVVISKEEFKLGVNEEQLKKIQKLSKQHREFNELLVKDGIAFFPPMFVAFILFVLI